MIETAIVVKPLTVTNQYTKHHALQEIRDGESNYPTKSEISRAQRCKIKTEIRSI